MKVKITAAIADMESKIERDSDHIYRNKIIGDMLQGVSTVSSIVPKDWLSAWGSKECAKALGFSDYPGDIALAQEMLEKIKNCDVKQYLAILKDAKGASARKSKQAMVDGKKGHAWLEEFVKARINGQAVPLLPGDTLDRPLTQFLKKDAKHIDHWIASEALVCNLERSYAGQLDAIAVLKTGELALIDFKFASHISEDYYLQTAGYQACFESYGIEFQKRVIIRLPKTLEKDEWDKTTYKYKKIPNDIEFAFVPTNYERDREAFYNALVVKSWINYVTRLQNNK